ncbi:MAG: alpha/beta hydrolase fold-domain-containing protein [Monoraphidium minutum]|nr:MAG: alpha/beta hydrolase fold-domain-containing protein [Monoraphidium minutum]
MARQRSGAAAGRLALLLAFALALAGRTAGQAAVAAPKKYSSVLADCTPADFGPPPKATSPQAQAILARFTGPPADTDTSREGVVRERERINGLSKSLSDKYQEAYVESSEVVDLGGVKAVHVTPKEGVAINSEPSDNAAPRDTTNAILYFHGGAYTLGDPEVQYQSYAPMAVATGMDVYAIAYRLAPENPYPAALDDAVAAYKALLLKYSPKHIVLAGGSAGGHLAAALLLKLAALKEPLPAVAVLFSPWALMGIADADTHFTLRCADPVLNVNALNASANFYRGAAKNFDSPYLSPGKANWKGVGAAYKAYYGRGLPVMIFSGTRELLLGDAAALADVMRRGAVNSHLRVYNGMWHSWSVGSPGPMMLPEAERATVEFADFVAKNGFKASAAAAAARMAAP